MDEGAKQPDIEIYESETGEVTLDVRLIDETVFLSLSQLSKLFVRDKSVISRHLSNIFSSGELDKVATIAFFATVQTEGCRLVSRSVEFYNLDAILSVGYRVNSKQGILFRRWASRVLQNNLIKGYSLNQKKITEKHISELRETIELLAGTIVKKQLVDELGGGVLDLISEYTKTWSTLFEYDKNNFSIQDNVDDEALIDLDYHEVKLLIESLKNELLNKGEASHLFAIERDYGLNSILGNISQTFDSTPVYSSNIERVISLLYFVIKDHPFVDGNKRIACFLFLVFLIKANISTRRMNNVSLVAIALLVAESDPCQKDTMLKLIMRLIED